MDELNGKLIACQILITGLIARVANEQRDPLRFLTDFRDEIKAVVNGVNIAGMDNSDRVRAVAQKELSRPDDGFAPASDAQSALLARVNRIYGVAARAEPIGTTPANFGFIID